MRRFMNTLSAEAERPPLHFIDTEADRLSGMAMTVQSRIPSVASMLMDEINRGEIHEAEDMPEGVVTMLSTVEFVDEGSGTRRTVQLVYPADADISSGKISILTPIGAGLIGLSEGQSILWPDRDGHERCLQIVKVTRAQEA